MLHHATAPWIAVALGSIIVLAGIVVGAEYAVITAIVAIFPAAIVAVSALKRVGQLEFVLDEARRKAAAPATAQLQERLNHESSRFHALAEAAPVAMLHLTLDSRVDYSNAGASDLFADQLERGNLHETLRFRHRDTDYRGLFALVDLLGTEGDDIEIVAECSSGERHLLVRFAPLDDGPAGNDEKLLVFLDITERHAAETMVRYHAYHDQLTGTLNRFAFKRELERLTADPDLAQSTCLIAIDLDKFKPVNDAHGHTAGDLVLRVIAERIGSAAHSDMRVFRMGGDEFTILCEKRATLDAMKFADELTEIVKAPIVIGGHEIRVGASVGISFLPKGETDVETLVTHADIALYTVKRRGGDGVEAYMDRPGSQMPTGAFTYRDRPVRAEIDFS